MNCQCDRIIRSKSLLSSVARPRCPVSSEQWMSNHLVARSQSSFALA